MEANIVKSNIIEGIRVGIVAFLICFVTIVFSASIINYVFLDEINTIMNGSLSDAPTPTLGTLLLMVSVMMNLSVFNSGGMLQNGGSLHIGLLIFIALPVIAFMIANRRDNKKERFNLDDMLIYSVSSVVYAAVLYLFSFIAKGLLIGIKVDFTAPLNIVMTIIIIMFIQFFIGLNYKKDFSPGIKMTRLMLRVLLGAGLIIGAIGLIYVLSRFGNIAVLIGAVIIMLPNVATYIMFTFMGASIDFGEQLYVLMDKFGIDISFATLPLIVRIGFIVIFFALVFYAIWKIQKERFIEEMILFATSFSIISLILAYTTRMNLGFVKNFLDVQFGINYIFAFVVPFTIIIFAGLLVVLLKKILIVVKS
jgi:hypothetical protein